MNGAITGSRWPISEAADADRRGHARQLFQRAVTPEVAVFDAAFDRAGVSNDG